jgi:hypothetical protein
MGRTDVSAWIVRGLYLFAIVLVLSPLLDLGSTVWPLRPTDLPWRYGFLGLAAGYLQTPILGFVIAIAAAHWTQDGGTLKALGIAMLVSAALVVTAMGMFLLDVLQMRGMREAEVQQAVFVGGMLQEVKYVTAALVLGALGLGALRTGAAHARGLSKRSS